MDLTEALLTTRSMRRLTNDPPVTEAEIWTCLRAAIQAPSGGNVQPWHFVVADDPETRWGVAELYRSAIDRYLRAMLSELPPFRSEDDERSFGRSVDLTRHLAEHLHETPFVVFCLSRYDHTLSDEHGPIDIGGLESSIFPAVQNFTLAARGLGLGTTLTTAIRIEQQRVKELLGLQERHDIVALVPIGRPTGRFGVAPRKPVDRVTSWNAYGVKRPYPES